MKELLTFAVGLGLLGGGSIVFYWAGRLVMRVMGISYDEHEEYGFFFPILNGIFGSTITVLLGFVIYCFGTLVIQ